MTGPFINTLKPPGTPFEAGRWSCRRGHYVEVGSPDPQTRPRTRCPFCGTLLDFDREVVLLWGG